MCQKGRVGKVDQDFDWLLDRIEFYKHDRLGSWTEIYRAPHGLLQADDGKWYIDTHANEWDQED